MQFTLQTPDKQFYWVVSISDHVIALDNAHTPQTSPYPDYYKFSLTGDGDDLGLFSIGSSRYVGGDGQSYLVANNQNVVAVQTFNQSDGTVAIGFSGAQGLLYVALQERALKICSKEPYFFVKNEI
jgi:hypothetical protein